MHTVDRSTLGSTGTSITKLERYQAGYNHTNQSISSHSPSVAFCTPHLGESTTATVHQQHHEQYDRVNKMFEEAKSGMFEIMQRIDQQYGHQRDGGPVTMRMVLGWIYDAYKVFAQSDKTDTLAPRTKLTYIHNAYDFLTAADKIIGSFTHNSWANDLAERMRRLRTDYEQLEDAAWDQIMSVE